MVPYTMFRDQKFGWTHHNLGNFFLRADYILQKNNKPGLLIRSAILAMIEVILRS